MISQPKIKCKAPGCTKIVSVKEGYCAAHKHLKEGRARKKQYNSRWTRLRNLHIHQFPVCGKCGKAGEQVDHIKALIDGGHIYDPFNLMTLCQACHSLKTQAVDIAKTLTVEEWLGRCKFKELASRI